MASRSSVRFAALTITGGDESARRAYQEAADPEPDVPARVVGFQPGDDLPFHGHGMSLHECTQVQVSVSPQVKYRLRMFTADVPKWRQLADLIRERIASGEYQPRQPIPSEHRLVEETGLSRSTVQKALRALRDEGTVYSVHGLGTFVAQKP